MRDRDWVRKLLAKVLPTTPLFDAFCVDFFPDVAHQLGDGMSRATKENRLFEMCEIDDVFDRLKREHAEAVNKHAVLLESEARWGSPTISGDSLVRILAIVKRQRWQRETIALAYYRSAPYDWRSEFDGNRSEDLVEFMVNRLATFHCEPGEAHPILRFGLHLMRLLSTSGAHEHTADLLDWFGRLADERGVSASARKEMQTEVELDDLELHLVVVIERRADPAYDIAVSAWRVLVPLGKDHWSADDVERIEGYHAFRCRSVDIQDIMTELLNRVQPQRAKAENRLTIEAIAPLELLGCDVDCWRPDPEDTTMAPYGAKHHVVVRSWERAYAVASTPGRQLGLNEMRFDWHEKWRQLSGNCTRATWACTRDEAASGIAEKLHAPGRASVALRFSPSGELHQLIKAGAPIIVWPRETPEDDVRFQDCITELETQTHPHVWHTKVKDYRSAAYAERDRTHPVRHIAVLRDDPNKLLPDARPEARFARPRR